MKSNKKLQFAVLMAARDQGINSILFRNAMAKKLGLNITDSFCLTILGIKGILTPKELAKYTGLTSGSTTSMLDRLEKKNFIRRKPHPTDRRGVLVELNMDYADKGKKLVAGIQKAHQKLISSYSDQELKVIEDFLKRFTDNLLEATAKLDS